MVKLKQVYPLYLNNKAEQPNTDLAVTDKFTGEVAFRVAQADAATIDKGIAGAVAAAEPMARMPAYERRNVLQHCVDRFTERADELAYALCVEAGKPIKDSEGEVSRLIDTFRIAAEESVRMTGEVQPLDISPRAKGYVGMWKRVPIGPCSFVSPFNFPTELGGAQDRARDRGRLSVRDEARQPHAAGGDHHRGSLGRDRLTSRCLFDPARASRRGRPVHRGRPAEAAVVHRIARRRLGTKSQGGQEEGGAGTRRAMPRASSTAMPIWTMRWNA